MKHINVLLILFVCSITSLNAGSVSKEKWRRVHKKEVIKADTTSALYQKYIGVLDSLNNDTVPMRYIKSDPDNYRLFLPYTFYRAPFQTISEMKWQPTEVKTEPVLPDSAYISYDKNYFSKSFRSREWTDKALMNLYVKSPLVVGFFEDEIMNQRLFQDNIVKEDKTKAKASILNLFRSEDAPSNVVETEFVIKKPNFWLTGGNGSIQFSQNYISKNWYKGGESTNNLQAFLTLFANYNDKEKIQWENMIEAKLGFNTAKSDTLHEYRVNSNVIRLVSKLGVRAVSKWYYTLSVDASTQIATNYKQNSNDVVTAFLAPSNVMINIGMDYKLSKKKFNLSVEMSPLSYNAKYIRPKYIDSEFFNESKFGFEQGRSTMHDVGSTVKGTFVWNLTSNIVLNSRLRYFTDYAKVEVEFENTFNMRLNKYLSTKLYFYGRFDDGIKKTGDSYFQYNELLSFGLNYSW